MAMTNQGAIKTLNSLYRICEAGERGFETAAANISNRGLKILLKTFAQQRAEFKVELQAEIERLGGTATQRQSIRGMIHRGRMDILATLTISAANVERLILSEALLGEQAALRTYQNALIQELPADTRAIVERQCTLIQEVGEEVARLRGHSDQHLVVRLFDSEADVETAAKALSRAGFSPDKIKIVSLSDVMSVYEGQGSTVTDTVVSGALGGAIWGSILGAVAGVGVLLVPEMDPFGAAAVRTTWALTALSGTLIGALFGIILGFLIGVGVAGEDTYLYEDSVQHGMTLIMVESEGKRAVQASHIMHQVNTASRERQGVIQPEYQ